MALKKTVVSKHLTLVRLKPDGEYYVEEKQNAKWVEIAGPFPDKASADKWAQDYSTKNPGVNVRVVLYQ